MFFAFEYGVMYVLSFATIITVFATAIALAALLVIAASGVCFAGGASSKTTVPAQSQCELPHTTVAQLRVALMVGKWTEQHWERNETVDGSDCPTLLVEYCPRS